MTTDPPEKFDPADRRRPRRLSDAQNEEIVFPLAWIIIGGLAALIVIGLLGIGIVNIFRQGTTFTPTPAALPPLVVTENTPTPVPDVSATDTPSPTDAVDASDGSDTPTPPPTDTPAPATPDIEVNGFVRVLGTEGIGVSLRAGPGRNNARVGIAEEDEAITLLVIDGPRTDENLEDFIWWFVRHPDGTEGWVVQDFIVPAN
ncbi:MAG: SH3 domain-containing protein [Chloroflexota bacterium]